MKKLGKKTHEMLETIEAYCSCTCSCYCTCSCTSDSARSGNYSSTFGTGGNWVYYGMGNSLAK